MAAEILDGRALAARVLEDLKPRVEKISASLGRPPLLAVLGGGDAAGASYGAGRRAACAKAGISLKEGRWAGASGPDQARAALSDWLGREKADAVLIATPLPDGIAAGRLWEALPSGVDAEGLSPAHYGRLFAARSYAEALQEAPVPPTARAVAELSRASGITLEGKDALVIGRSNAVGRPAAHLLSLLGLTVTLAHSMSRGIEEMSLRADLLVACLGRRGYVRPDWIKPGAVVVDCGIHASESGLAGDVDPGAARRAGFLTPVPGGVGPATSAFLAANVVWLAERNSRSY